MQVAKVTAKASIHILHAGCKGHRLGLNPYAPCRLQSLPLNIDYKPRSPEVPESLLALSPLEHHSDRLSHMISLWVTWEILR